MMNINLQEVLDELNNNAGLSVSPKHPGQIIFRSKYRYIQAVAICNANSIAAQFVEAMLRQNPRVFYDKVAKIAKKYHQACVPLLVIDLKDMGEIIHKVGIGVTRYVIKVKPVGSVIIRKASNTNHHVRQNITSLTVRAEQVLKTLLLNFSIRNFRPRLSGATFTLDFPEADITLTIRVSGAGKVFRGSAFKSLKLRYRDIEVVGNMGLDVTITRNDNNTDNPGSQLQYAPIHHRVSWPEFPTLADMPTRGLLSQRHSLIVAMAPYHQTAAIATLIGTLAIMLLSTA